MKKIIFFFTLVLATAMFYGYSQSGKNELTEKNAKSTVSRDSKGDVKTEVLEPGTEIAFDKQVNSQKNRKSIMIILTADKSKPGWSTSFLRNYIYGNANQEGC